MKTLSIPAEQLLTILIGQPTTIHTKYTGLLLLASKKHNIQNLPSEMAGAIVHINENQQITLVSLVHPFHVASEANIFDTPDELLHREPYNWFGPQALIIEKALTDFAKTYDGPLTKDGNIPRELIPDKIVKPALLSDLYWQDYKQFVNDETGDFSKQIKPLFQSK